MRKSFPIHAAAFAAIACSVSCSARKDAGPPDDFTDDPDTGSSSNGDSYVSPFDLGTDETPIVNTNQLTITPGNDTIFIDTAATPAAAATETYKVVMTNPDGTTKDVTGSSTFTIEDPTLGTFASNVFTSVTSLPTGALGVSTVVHATAQGLNGSANLTVVALRKSGTSQDFYFVVPYQKAPTPDRDELKFSTNIKQVDVAFVIDTTGSMSGAVGTLKTNLSKTIIPAIAAAIPDVGIAVVHHDDIPNNVNGIKGTDQAVEVFQTITTDVTAAQAGANKLKLDDGDDEPESQIPAMDYVLTGKTISWTGSASGSVPAHTPATGTFGGVDFRPGGVPIVAEASDANWHNFNGQPDYCGGTNMYSGVTAADYNALVADFKAAHARYLGLSDSGTGDCGGGAIGLHNKLSDDTSSNVAPVAFGSSGKCPTGVNGASETPGGPGGSCRLVFKISAGNGLSTGVGAAIQAISVGSYFDVTAVPKNDPTNPVGSDGQPVDATKFIDHLRAMDEGDPKGGCPAHDASDTDGDGIKDTFIQVKTGDPVCFEVIPHMNQIVKPAKDAQFFNAFIDVLGMPGSVNLDERKVLFLVPPKDVQVQ